MSAATGPAAGRMDLGPMRDQLQARIDVINAEIVALEAERAELGRVLGAMPEPPGAPEMSVGGLAGRRSGRAGLLGVAGERAGWGWWAARRGET